MKTLLISLTFLLTLFDGYSQVTNNFLLEDNIEGVEEPLDIYIFGNGGIRSAATNGMTENNNSVSGALGVTFIANGKTDLTLGYSINDFTTISIGDVNEYGSNILTPDLNGRSFSASVTHFYSKKIAANLEFQLADSKWEIDNRLIESSPLALKINAVWAPFGNLYQKGNNFVTAAFTVGFSTRSLLGNIQDEKKLLMDNFGTDKTTFSGVEIGGYLVLNQTKVFVNVPYFKSETPIDGLTGGQVVFGATFTGEFLKL